MPFRQQAVLEEPGMHHDVGGDGMNPAWIQEEKHK